MLSNITVVSNQLEEISSCLPDDESIPNFGHVRPLLVDIFSSDNGPAIILISHYYITAQTVGSEFFHDPMLQAKWCYENIPYFSKVAKYFRMMRNKLVHKEFLSFDLLKKTISTIILFSKKESKAVFILENIISSLITVCQIILGCHISSNICKHCLQPLPISNIVDNSPIVPLLPDNQISIQFPQSLNDLKSIPNMKEILKGSRIVIHAGTWKDHMGTFRSWAGTVAVIDIDQHGKMKFPLRTPISIIQ